MFKFSTSSFSALALLTCAMSAQAEWTLDGGASSLYYVTSKASAVSELNSFPGLSGSISDAGAASLVIDLASVETSIAIRNERMRDLVFQVAQFPAATVSVSVDNAALAAMPVGGTTAGSHVAKVDLHGMSQELTAELQIIKLDATSVQVQTLRPLIVGAGLFGLVDGVEQLRVVAGLPSINPNVVVTFTLVYRQ